MSLLKIPSPVSNSVRHGSVANYVTDGNAKQTFARCFFGPTARFVEDEVFV